MASTPFTPLIKQLNQNGTTFYTFSSAAKDLSKCMANTQKEFVFSHFVCLNIPDFININNYDHNGQIGQNNNQSGYCPASPLNKNYCQLGGIHDLLNRDYNENPQTVKSTSLEFAELLQDYVFNFEELLLYTSDDNNTDRSVAERVFWHWLKETGSINWKYDQSKVAPSLLNQQEMRFVEGMDNAPSTYNYENVVKYIGEIDITNNVDVANDAYTEVYIHIPSEYGNTPVVLFQQEFDGNFEESSTPSLQNNGYIFGQNGTTMCPVQDTRGLYDAPNETYQILSTIPFGSQPSTQLDSNQLDNNWKINAYKTALDGVCIDFNANSYADIVLNNIPNMNEFNKTGDSFEFNAVLVYYDIVDISSQTRTSNLYGVLFLDNVKSDYWDYFQRYPKFKPIAGVQNGNSYGFKLNLRIDVEPDQAGITTLVNEYNTFSMSMFGDAIARMQQCADMFNNVTISLSNLDSRLSDIETVMTTISNYEVLAAQVSDLAQSLENANLAFANSSTLLDLIANVSDNVNSIMNGTASVQLQYNTNVIQEGYNTSIDTNTPNQIRINTNCSGYNLTDALLMNDNTTIDIDNPIKLNDPQRQDNNIKTSLKEMTNMVRIWVDDNIPSIYDIDLYIDSSLISWKNGQNFKIVFPSMSLSTLNLKNINIHTGVNYNESHTIYYNDLLNDHPIIELICVDETFSNQDSFVHDVLR